MKKPLISVALGIVLALTACGSDDPEPPTNTPTPDLPGDAKWVWTEHPDTGEQVWCVVFVDGDYGTGFDCLAPTPTTTTSVPR